MAELLKNTSIFFSSWMDGSKVDFVAWATGEPNFANDDENCVTMYTNSGRLYTPILLNLLWGVICGIPCIFRLKVASNALIKKRTETPNFISIMVQFAKINL